MWMGQNCKIISNSTVTQALKISSQDYMGAKVGILPRTLLWCTHFDLCFIPTKDSYNGYMSIVNPDYFWSGEVPARVFLI